MCGIAGYYNFDGAPVERDVLLRLCSALKHRGPDDDGTFLSDNVGMAHTRLSILDLSPLGAQPMESERYVIAFNGEIYNFKALRQALCEKGYSFRTHTDTEVLLRAFEEYGEACLNQLNGMFAFAVFDKDHRRLFLARDRFGIKPLYYAHVGSQFCWASETTALVRAGLVEKQLNLQAVSDLLTFAYVPEPETIYDGVTCLAPGSYLWISPDGAIEQRRYWRAVDHLDKARYQGVSDDDIVGGLQDCLEDAVRLRQIADVPVGTFLSGGLDSTAIALFMKRQQADLHTFTLGSAHRGMDESELARQTAQRLGTHHHEYMVEDTDLADVFDEMTGAMHQPHAGGFFENYLVSKIAREHITVSLSGAGSDELLAGYHPFRQWFQRAHALSRFMPSPLIAVLKYSLRNVPVAGTAARVLWIGEPADILDREVRRRSYTDAEKNEIMLSRAGQPFEPSRRVYQAAIADLGTSDDLTTYMLLDLNGYMRDEVLQLTDVASMAHALEVRVPFLDHRLVEYALNMPTHLKLKGRTTKVALRRILEGQVPSGVLAAKKRGFATPRFDFLRQGLRAQADDVFSEASLRRRGLFDPALLSREWQEFNAHRGSMMWAQFCRIWTPFTLETWLRKHFD